jgi:hypothetical protein
MKTISVVLLVLLASCGNQPDPYQKADRVALGNSDRAGNDSSSEADSDDTYTKRKNQTDPRKADIPKSNADNTEKVHKDEMGPEEDSDDAYSKRKNHTAPPVNPEH